MTCKTEFCFYKDVTNKTKVRICFHFSSVTAMDCRNVSTSNYPHWRASFSGTGFSVFDSLKLSVTCRDL